MRRRFRAARARSASAAISAPASIELIVGSARARGSARCSEEVSPRSSLSSSLAKPREIVAPARCCPAAAACRAAAPVPASSIARVHAAGARAEPAQRMLQQRQQRRRLQPVRTRPRRPAARKCRPACPSARRRRNRRTPDSSGRAPPSRAAPARGPASPAPRICSARCASRIATAIASASISGLAAAITARLGHARRDLLPRPRARPAACAIARSHSTAASPRTPASRGHAAQGSPSVSRRSRLMPNRVEQPCSANCGWFDGGRRVNAPSRICDAADQLPRRRRRDRYRAPAAPPRLAAAARWHAAILRSTASSRSSLPRSPGRRDARSGARLRPRSADRAAPPVRSCRVSARMRRPAVSRDLRESRSVSCQYRSSASGTSPSSARQSTPRVAMSSISRARSSASASVEAGPPTTSGACAGSSGLICFAHAAISCASSRRRCSPSSAGGNVERGRAPASAACAKASSSSSMSPSATMRGSITASVLEHIEKDFARHAPGAAGRQIERRLRPAVPGCARGLEALDQPAVDQRGDDACAETARMRGR